jgi:protein phosphatase
MTEYFETERESSMVWRGFGRSETGLVRPANQDRLAVLNKYRLWIVADGMGGHPAGDLAASIAVHAVTREASRQDSQNETCTTNHAITLKGWLRTADRAIRERTSADQALYGMGTTIVAALIPPTSTPIAHIAHVGDSRAYLYRDGKLMQLTRDHTFVGKYLASGLIDAAAAKTHPKRHVLMQALGMDGAPTVDCSSVPLRPDDLLVLCSDGLNKMLEDDDIAKLLSATPGDSARACHDLVEESLRRGGEDNVTVIVCAASRNAPRHSH